MRRLLVLGLLALASTADAQWTPQVSGTNAEFRGLSAVSPTIAWAGLSLAVCIDAHGTPNARAAASALASSSRGRPLNA